MRQADGTGWMGFYCLSMFVHRWERRVRVRLMADFFPLSLPSRVAG